MYKAIKRIEVCHIVYFTFVILFILGSTLAAAGIAHDTLQELFFAWNLHAKNNSQHAKNNSVLFYQSGKRIHTKCSLLYNNIKF